MKVGNRVGKEDGFALGSADGSGVGLPSLYVGAKDGEREGGKVGRLEGSGDGFPNV